MDYSELWHGRQTPIQNALDLQVVDVVSRKDTEYRRIFHLSSRCFPMARVRAMQHADIHALNGLRRAAREHSEVQTTTGEIAGEWLVQHVNYQSHS